jgi:DNA polymerase sigma
VVVVKTFLASKKMNAAPDGMRSYLATLLSLHVAQTVCSGAKRLVLPLQLTRVVCTVTLPWQARRGDNLGHLLIEFLRLYGHTLDCANVGISVRDGSGGRLDRAVWERTHAGCVTSSFLLRYRRVLPV